jgi:hypothetical protein
MKAIPRKSFLALRCGLRNATHGAASLASRKKGTAAQFAAQLA